MQGFVLLALLAVGCHGARVTSRTEQTALAWLQAHQDPDAAGMADLKAENPDAYAMVNALLTKKSLGLLNPMHPNPNSFASDDQSQHTDGPNAVDVLKASMPSDKVNAIMNKESEEDIPVEAVQEHHSHRNWLSWKPANSAADDDAMVKNVLGMVGGIASGASAESSLLSNSRSSSSASDASASSLSMDAMSLGSDVAPPAPKPHRRTGAGGMPNLDWGSVAPAPVADSPPPAAMSQQNSYLSSYKAVAPKPVAAAMNAQNSYLSNIDFSADMPKKAEAPKHTASMGQTNSYLTGINFGAAKEEKDDAENSLASFSFSSDDEKVENKPKDKKVSALAEAKAATAQYMEKMDDKAAPAMGFGSLGSWLGESTPAIRGGAAAMLQMQAKPVQKAQSKYLADLLQ